MHYIPPEEVKKTDWVAPDGNWRDMYRRDRYARDRVMKSARLLLPHLKDNDLILDVGCFTQEASKYYPPWVKYQGIDEKAYHPHTKVVNLHHGFDPIEADHILCLETLEHLINPEEVLHSISNSLKNNGRIVVSLPNEATIFHRIRCLLGKVDAGCFQSNGKHLHLPSLKQSKQFLLEEGFLIEKVLYYISPSACGSQQAWVGRILKLLPDVVHQWLADYFPSLFARGFIFLLQKPQLVGSESQPCPPGSPSS